MKVFYSLVFASLFVGSAMAQLPSTASITHPSSEHVAGPFTVSPSEHSFFNAPSKATAEEVTLSYFDPNVDQRIAWPLFITIGGAQVIGYSQRFTLPTATGKVLTISAALPQAQGDTVRIFLLADSLYDLSPTPLHFYELNKVYAAVDVPVAAIPTSTATVTLDFGTGVPVGKEFHVLVMPRLAGSTNTSSFQALSDDKNTRQVTTETARSGYLAITPTNQLTRGILDGITISGRTAPVTPDFYVAVTATTDASGVGPLSAHNVVLFPNPAPRNSSVSILLSAKEFAAVRVLDLLGNEVFSSTSESGSVTIDTRGFAAGVYQAIVTVDGVASVHRFVVR